MAQEMKQLDKVFLDRKYLEDLKQKASFLEDLLFFIEDRYLGFLMKKTETEEDISLFEAKELLK